MPIAILKFKLPEESEEYKTTMSAGAYHSALWEIAQYARTLRKYDERELIPIDEVVERLNALLAEIEL